MAATLTHQTVAATCRRCGTFDNLDGNQRLCRDCTFVLGLSGMERFKVAVHPLRVCEGCGTPALAHFKAAVRSCAGEATIGACATCIGYGSVVAACCDYDDAEIIR
jgi:hypothetical protein